MSSKSLKKRMEERRQKLAAGSGNFKFFIFPVGTTRMRHVPVGDNEPAMEVLYIFLSKELGGIISPATWGDKCAFKEAFEELKGSKKDSDNKFAEKVKPKRKFVSAAYRYKDEKGKDIDHENGVKLALLNKNQFEIMIDLFLDDDEGGDFTDPKDGYDLKHKRTGTGQYDTKYNVIKCQPTKLDKKYRGPYDLEKMARDLTPSYKETKKLLDQFLNLPSDDDRDDRPKKKKKKKDL